MPNANGYRISSGFFTGSDWNHAGLDLANGVVGGEVRSIAAGQVVEKRETDSGFGYMLRIRHTLRSGGPIYSLYGHMLTGSLTVNVGDQVTKGEKIGKLDSTGVSRGAHLHFAIRIPNDSGCGYVPSQIQIPQCATDSQSNYSDPLAFIAGPQWLNFVEGNPGVPGDGIFISPAGGTNPVAFEVLTPFPLGGATDGITVTAFFSPNVLDFVLMTQPINAPSPCRRVVFSGGFSGGTIVFNGVQGAIENFPQSSLQAIVALLNQAPPPGCSMVSLSDLYVVGLINFLQPDLDAAAIAFGQNAVP